MYVRWGLSLDSWLKVIQETGKIVDKGISPANAGWILSLMQLAILPITFIVPILAGGMSNQRILVITTSVLYLFGIFGLLFYSYSIGNSNGHRGGQ